MPAPYHIRLYRLACLVMHLAVGVALAGAVLPFVTPRRRDRIASRWAFRLLDILNVRLSISRCGQIPAAQAAVYVANHVSWIDIVALKAVAPARFVAKSEIRRWPVIGWLARQTGTLFIRRRSLRDVRRIVQGMREALRAGDCLTLFPEGTSTNGTGLRPFRTGLFQAAVEAEALVCPVAIRYMKPDGTRNTAAVFTGEMSLMPSLWRVVGETSLHVVLDFAEPISARNKARRAVAQYARTLIAAALRLSGTRKSRQVRRRVRSAREKSFTLSLY